MDSRREPMIAWCVEELRKAGIEGILIFALFNKLELAFGNTAAEKAQVWEALVANGGVLVAEDDGEKALNHSAIGTMSFEHILTSSHGGKKVRVEVQQELPSTTTTETLSLPISNQEEVAHLLAKTNASENVPQPLVAKKRGRPPKIRPDGAPPTRRPAGGPRGRPKGSSKAPSIQPEQPTVMNVASEQPAVDLNTATTVTDQAAINPLTPSSLPAAEASRDEWISQTKSPIRTTPPLPVTSLPSFSSTELSTKVENSGGQISGDHSISIESQIPETEEEDTVMVDIPVIASRISVYGDPAQELVSKLPEPSSLSPVPSTLFNAEQLPNLETSPPDLEGPSIVVEVARNNPEEAREKTSRPFQPAAIPENNFPRASKVRQPLPKDLPQGLFTSQDNLDREAGLPRVYIDPTGSRRVDFHAGKGRRPKSSIAVFKSEKLKTPEWLEKRRGTWIEVYAERLASRLIEVEDEAQSPQKRGKRKRQNTLESDGFKTQKKTKLSKNVGVSSLGHGLTLEFPADIQGASNTLDPRDEPPNTVTEDLSSPTGQQETGHSLEPSLQEHIPHVDSQKSPPAGRLVMSNVHPTNGNDNRVLSPTMTSVSTSTQILHGTPLPASSTQESVNSQGHLSVDLTSPALNKTTAENVAQDQSSQPAFSPYDPRSHSPTVIGVGSTNSHRTHPFDPSQEFTAMNQTVGNHGHGHSSVPTPPSRPYVSPFAPTNSYQSPYMKSNYASNYEQSQIPQSQFTTPVKSHSYQNQWPASSTSPPPVGPAPTQPSRRKRKQPSQPTANQASLTNQLNMQMQPQSQAPKGNMLDFHHRYSSVYTPQRQTQSPAVVQQPQTQVPGPQNTTHLHSSPAVQSQDPWLAIIKSQFRSGSTVLPSRLDLVQAHVPQIVDPEIVDSSLPRIGTPGTTNGNQPEVLTMNGDEINAVDATDKSDVVPLVPTLAAPSTADFVPSLAIDQTETLESVPTAEALAPVAQTKRKYTRKPKIDEPEEDEITPRLYPADAVEIPEGITRLACVFNDAAGNLLLSKDMAALNFFDFKQNLSDDATFTLPISSISQNPIVSMPGSKRMELRMKSKDENNSEITHCFVFAPGTSSTVVATNMRTKIVTAMIACRFRSGDRYDRPSDVETQLKKKYLCEKCGSRFKNINGLQYHQTKSNTICNPNYVPKVVAPKIAKEPKAVKASKHRKSRRRKASSDDGDDDGITIEAEILGGGDDMIAEDLQDSDIKVSRHKRPRKLKSTRSTSSNRVIEHDTSGDSDASNSSDDSILEWAKQHTTTGVERVPKQVDESVNETPRNNSRLYKALNRETEVLQKIVKDITAPADTIADSTEVPGETTTSLAEAEVEAQAGLMNQIAHQLLSNHAEDAMNDNLCEDVLMALIRANDGIFPGDRGIWFACTAVWLKMHPLPKNLPRSTLPSKAIDSLLQNRKIEKMAFSFQDKKKRHITRNIVYIPGTDLKCAKVDAMKSLIQEATPSFYVPSEFTPPPAVLETLQALASRAVATNLQKRNAKLQSQSVEPESAEPESPTAHSLPDDLFDDDDDDDDDEFIDNADPAMESESDADAEMDEILSESDEELQEVRPRMKPDKRRRSAHHNAAISEGVRRKWNDVRAGGDNPFRRGQEKSQFRRTRGAAARLSQEEKDQRALAAERRQQSWGQALAFMPNSETGAWNQTPPKSKGKYTTRRLPEPITYLQDLSTGAWSVRPFGHGVNPIFARPGRRADGNPLFGQYMKRIQSSFRPVVYPKKNRMFLPGPPSKALRDGISMYGEPVSDGKKSKRQSRKKPALRQFIEPEDSDSVNRRISLATGKPVRIYRRKFHKEEGEISSEGDTDQEDGLSSVAIETPYMSVRSRAQKARFMSEVEILNFYEPKKLRPGEQLNPGLDSLPPSFGLDVKFYGGSGSDLDYKQERKLNFRTPRSIDHILIDPNYASWTMDSLETPKNAKYNLRWDDQTAFTLETLPYGQLEDESVPSSPVAEEAPPPKRRRIGQGNKWIYSRLLTAHTSDFFGIFDDPYEAVREFGVQMGGSIDHGRKRRQQKVGAVMPPLIEIKFLVTVIMVRTLTGGLDNLVDWVIVQALFPKMSHDFLKKQWKEISKKKALIIERLIVDFQDAFLRAYEKGEVDSLDYDDLPGYDWQKLQDWVMENVDTQMGNKPITLPDTREEFDDQYNAVKLDRDESGWRENFYLAGAPVYRRIESAAAEPNSFPIASQDIDSEEITDLVVAKSWLRAVALTPERDYLSSVASARMDELGKKLSNQAFDALIEDKVIVHRNRNRAAVGRGYEAAEPFFRPLNKYLKAPQFIQAVNYKRWLDEQFLNGATFVRADYMADEGAIMCMTSLQAHGRIKLIPIDVPVDKFGLTDGGYETRQIPRERLRFEIDIYPTSTYLYDHDNTEVNQALSTPPPVGSGKGELPIWFGITDRLILELWTKVLMSVGSVLALRAGTNMVFLRRIFKSTLEEWEFRLLLKWGEEVGFLKSLGEKGQAWTVGEWWWLIAGKSVLAGTEGEDTEMVDV